LISCRRPLDDDQNQRALTHQVPTYQKRQCQDSQN
jgi:hypothetical protein